MLGVLFAILSSACFGLNNASTRRGVLTGSAAQGVYITVILGVPLFFLATLASGQLFRLKDITGEGYLLLAAAGIVHYLLGRYYNYRAIAVIGSNRTAPVQTVSVIYTLFLAVVFLDESISAVRWLGVALVLIAPLVMLQWDRRARRTQASDPLEQPIVAVSTDSLARRPAPSTATSGQISAQSRLAARFRLVEGYVFAIVGGLGYGTSPILIREALSGNSLGILGGLVSYVAAAV
ncbi:MAG TPA: DMT family transporter, partial [Dehalococcoidia bacterium]|nr:DMT family transporter [Dehalococcoidia bacterium]